MEKRFEAIFEQSLTGIAIVGLQGEWININPSFCQFLGYDRAELLGRTVQEVTHPNDLAGDLIRFVRLLAGEMPYYELDKRYLRKDGEIVWGQLGLNVVRDERGEAKYCIAQVVDITKRKKLEDVLIQQAIADDLTGLLNYRGFSAELESAIASGEPFSLVAVGLDYFKPVNDLLGQEAGNELLVRAANVVREAAGRLCARLGGDEFYCLVFGAAAFDEEGVRSRIRDIRVGRFSGSASVGIVPYEPGLDSKAMLSLANLALVRAKQEGRDRAVTIAGDSKELEQQQERVNWKLRLESALRGEGRDRLVVYCQPIFPLLDRRGEPAAEQELLVRLREESGTVISAGAFIEAICHYPNLSQQLDLFVLERALQLICARQGESFHLAINLSGASLSSPDFLVRAETLFERFGCGKGKLRVEVAEQQELQLEVAGQLLDWLRELGCKIVADDFGTGYSSLEWLAKLQFDAIKIDGRFVRAVEGDRTSRAIIRAILQLAAELEMPAIAEQIETERQLEAIEAIARGVGGVTLLGQGWLFQAAEPCGE